MRHLQPTPQPNGVAVDFTPAPIADDDLAYLLKLLFAQPTRAVAA
ncbi:hypothetical protein [Microbacterium sp. ZXX196]|nr:hypothetical protein [Microbacterium sp. ZXX196]